MYTLGFTRSDALDRSDNINIDFFVINVLGVSNSAVPWTNVFGNLIDRLAPPTDPAKAWLSQRAAHWANMYLPGTAPENSTCQRALQAMAASLADNSTLWAAKIVDSWAKVPDGLYSGNWALEGVYDECVGASSPDGDVWGKFCRVFVSKNRSQESGRHEGGCGAGALDACARQQARLPPLFPTSLNLAPFKTYSTCMPDACAEHDLQESVSAALSDSSLAVRRVQCHTLHEAPEFTAGDIAFMF
nr:uncharacterized protein LOC113820669 [Penaeus vannamei]